MLAIERREKIMELLRSEKTVHLAQLRELFRVTDETLRKDLDALEQQGQIKRTYGGATLREQSGSLFSPPAKDRYAINKEGKSVIAQLATQLIEPGEALFLDGSTSSIYLASCIPDNKNITVVTNSDEVVRILSKSSGINVMCIGGMLRKRNMSFIGSAAVSMIHQLYYASKMFFSCYGISSNAGLTDSDESEAEIKRAMMERCEKRVFLCDQSKFNRIGYPKLADFEQIDIVVTEAKPSEVWRDFFEQRRIQVIFPQEGPVKIYAQNCLQAPAE